MIQIFLIWISVAGTNNNRNNILAFVGSSSFSHSFVCQCVLKQHNRAERVWSLVLQDLSSCYNTATYYPVIHGKGMNLSDPQLLDSSKVLKMCSLNLVVTKDG